MFCSNNFITHAYFISLLTFFTNKRIQTYPWALKAHPYQQSNQQFRKFHTSYKSTIFYVTAHSTNCRQTAQVRGTAAQARKTRRLEVRQSFGEAGGEWPCAGRDRPVGSERRASAIASPSPLLPSIEPLTATYTVRSTLLELLLQAASAYL